MNMFRRTTSENDRRWLQNHLDALLKHWFGVGESSRSYRTTMQETWEPLIEGRRVEVDDARKFNSYLTKQKLPSELQGETTERIHHTIAVEIAQQAG